MSAYGRSTLVSFIAWSGIVLGVIMALIGMAQLVLIDQLFQGVDSATISARLPDDPNTAAVVRLMADYGKPVFMGVIAFSVMLFLLSLALLRRRNWARLVYMAVFLVSAIVGIAGLFYLGDFMELSSAMMAEMPDAETLSDAAFTIFLVITFLQTVLLLWLLARFRSEAVRREFL